MKPETLKGHLELLLLATVSSGATHGYAIIKALRERSGALLDLPDGTMYPALHRLESAGLLASGWSSDGGRRKRVYELTPAGHEALEHARSEWGAFSSAVDSVIEWA
jgi:DNA-binding PadR family transcriptional regulator